MLHEAPPDEDAVAATGVFCRPLSDESVQGIAKDL